jgi:hypothetical protein
MLDGFGATYLAPFGGFSREEGAAPHGRREPSASALQPGAGSAFSSWRFCSQHREPILPFDLGEAHPLLPPAAAAPWAPASVTAR